MIANLPTNLPANLLPPLHRLLVAWERETMPQTILLSGSPGVGKKKIAIEMAKILSCQNPNQKPCGECFSCKASKPKDPPDGQNPWLWLLPMRSPTASSERAKKEARIEKTDQLARQITLDPFVMEPYEDGSGHLVGAVRDLLERFQFHETNNRVVLIPEAERMNESTANALLKTLEEAPANTYFILTTSNKSQLLPTVISRCLHIPVMPLDFGDFQECLRTDHIQSSEEEATLLFALSEGCWGKALAWHGRDLQKSRNQCLEFLKLLQSRSHYQSDQWLRSSKIADDRPHLAEFLQILYLITGDLVAIQTGVLPRNRDCVDQLKNLKDLVPLSKSLEILNLIQQALRRLQRHLPSTMNIHTLLLEWESLLLDKSW